MCTWQYKHQPLRGQEDGGPVHSAVHPPHSLSLGATLCLPLANLVHIPRPLPLYRDPVYKARIWKWESGLRFQPWSNCLPDQSHIKSGAMGGCFPHSVCWKAEKAAAGREKNKADAQRSRERKGSLNTQLFRTSALFLLFLNPSLVLILQDRLRGHLLGKAFPDPPNQLPLSSSESPPFFLPVTSRLDFVSPTD